MLIENEVMGAFTKTCESQESHEEGIEDLALVNWKQRLLRRLFFGLNGNGLTQEQCVSEIFLSDEG
jgi:hypothetical protein